MRLPDHACAQKPAGAHQRAGHIVTLLALLLILCACAHPHHHKHTPPPPLPPPTTITTSVMPASIVIDPATGWGAAPTANHMPVYTDLETFLQFFPPALQGSLVIQRRGSGDNPDVGFLDGHVSVPTAATLYLALKTQVDESILIPPDKLEALAKEGWQRVPGIFDLSSPPGQHPPWQVWSHPLPPGPITLTSKALPDGGIFFIGRLR
jgi:hypothetical protein